MRRWQEEAEAAKSDADGLNSEEEDGVMDLCFVSGQHLGKTQYNLKLRQQGSDVFSIHTALQGCACTQNGCERN